MRVSRCFLYTTLMVLATALPAAATTLVVDATGGGDHLTLATAVAAASDGDHIVVMPGIYPTSITIEKSLLIEGQGTVSEIVLTGANQRILLLQGDHEVTLRNLTLCDGFGDSGGGILSWQGMDLTVEDCEFRANHATWGGGAIEARSATGRLTVSRCLFEDNTADHHAGGVAVMFDIPCEISDSVFFANVSSLMAGAFTANNAGPADIHHCVFAHNSGHPYGAIYVVESNGISIASSTFYGTTAFNGAAIVSLASTVTMERNILTHTTGGYGVYADSTFLSDCNIYFANATGNLSGVEFGPHDLVIDPDYCDADGFVFAPCNTSPAVIGDCGLIGALAPTCDCDDPVPVHLATWTEVKALYR